MPVSFKGWVEEVREIFRENRIKAIGHTLRCLYLGMWFTVTSRYPLGTNIYEREWDALIVLDACRVDALREVADEYDYLDEIGSIWSVGTNSFEWLVKTFTTDYLDEISRTAHVTANGFSNSAFILNRYAPAASLPIGWPKENVVTEADFAYMEHAWQHGRNEDLRTVAPRYMTDRSIDIGRNVDADRIVIHYNQPHTPLIADAVREERSVREHEVYPFPHLLRGDVQRADLWQAYLDNLRLALDDIELLLENLDAETVVITADHGEIIGRWVYAHPGGIPWPSLKKVPWAVTTATDTHTYDPTVKVSGPAADVEEHLADLGYL